jgi:hypothetical protein
MQSSPAIGSTSRGDVEIAAEHVAEAECLLSRPRQGMVDAPHQERQGFAEVAEDNLQARMGVEHA